MANYSLAEDAIKNEKQRQGIINTGLGQIDAIFGGGTVPFYTPVTNKFSVADWRGGGKDNAFFRLGSKGDFKGYYAPKGRSGLQRFGESFLGGNVLDLSGQGLIDQLSNKNWMRAFKNKDILGIATGGLFGFGADNKSPRELVNTQVRRNNLFTMSPQTFEGFQPEFYKQREKAYTDFAMPEFADQYRTNRDAILYGLANRGSLGGSVQRAASSKLERAAGKGRQAIADTGIAQSQDLKKSIEAARQNAINQLYTASRPSDAVASAISTAGGFRAPSTFAPLGDLFSGLAKQYYANQLFNNYRGGGGVYGNETYSLPSAPVSIGG